MKRILDEIFEGETSALRCPKCNGKAAIEPQSWPYDNRGKKILRCMNCDFEGSLDWLHKMR